MFLLKASALAWKQRNLLDRLFGRMPNGTDFGNVDGKELYVLGGMMLVQEVVSIIVPLAFSYIAVSDG